MYISKLSADSDDQSYLETTDEQSFNLQYHKIVSTFFRTIESYF